MFTRTVITKTAEGGVIPPYRLVVSGSADGLLALATVATSPFIGVSTEVGADDDGTVEAFIEQIPNIEYGDTVLIGAKLTSDSVGRAITATVGQNIIGIAMVAGVVDDIGEVLIDRALA